MPDEFYGDETLLTSHETSSFSLLITSEKMKVFNVIKLSVKLIETGLRPSLNHSVMVSKGKKRVRNYSYTAFVMHSYYDKWRK